MKRRFFLSLVFALIATYSQAQLLVQNAANTGNWAEYYVNEILLGAGVTAFNISFTTDSVQIGEFSNTNTVINMTDGVVLSCGNVEDAPGPNSSTGITTAIPGSQPDNDLFILSTDPIDDAAILEFDFVPSGDSVSFNYTFASDEYNEYVGGSVNDAFGFFLSGPGISGGMGFTNDAVNLAIIPGTSTQVSINTVNLDSNATYYINNDTSNTIEYDGLTTLLRAEYQVNCGDTYHIKLCIGDGGDQILDSGVFLEGGSFSSNFVDITLETANGDSTITEGCGAVTLNFSRTDICFEANVGLTFSGVAINGVDFPLLPDSITMAVGQTDTSISVVPFLDGVIEGPEPFTITATRISLQGDTFTSTGTFVLLDSSLLNMVSSPDTAFGCRPDSFMLGTRVLTGGPAPYTYIWNVGGTTDSINYLPTPGPGVDTLIVSVQDSCGITTTFDTILIFKNYDFEPIVDIQNDSLVNCIGEGIDLFAQVSFGKEPFNYLWSTGDTNDTLPVVVNSDTSYIVTITDSCGFVSVDTAYVGVKSVDSVSFGFPGTFSYCQGFELEVNPAFTGGVYPLSFSWDISNPVYDDDSTITITVNQDTTLFFGVMDACGRMYDTTFFIDAILTDPLQVSLPSSDGDCSGTEFELVPAISGGLQPFTYKWSDGSSDSAITFVGNVTQYVSVTVTDACDSKEKAQALISIPEYDPLELYLVGDTALCLGAYSELRLEARGGAGDYQFELLTDLVLDQDEVFELVYSDSAIYKLSFENNHSILVAVADYCGNTVADSVSFTVSHCISIPNVITPNGDGINDAFKISNITNIPDASVTIYNRWGQRVYQSNRYLNDWVPSNHASGTYFYVVRSSKFPELRGSVTVIND